MKKYLVLMTGFPGTGKTVAANKLCEHLEDYVLISQNDLRRRCSMRRMPQTQDEVLRRADRMIAAYLNQGKGVIFDSVNRHTFRRQQIYGVGSCCGVNVLTIETTCSEEEAKKRIRRRPKSDGLLSDPNNPRVYDKTLKFWEDVMIDFKWPGLDHVSYICFNTEKYEIERRVVGKGTEGYIKKIEKILLG